VQRHNVDVIAIPGSALHIFGRVKIIRVLSGRIPTSIGIRSSPRPREASMIAAVGPPVSTRAWSLG
jgi:hypothetical protein